MAAVLALVIAVVGAALGPTGRLDSLLSGTQAAVVSGQVQVREGSFWQDLPVGATAGPGSWLRTTDGAAVIAVGQGRVELGPGTELVLGPAIGLLAGTVVIEGEQVRDVEVQGATAAGRGAWRVDVSGRVASYEGSVVLTDVAGVEHLVRRYEQLPLVDGLTTSDPVPYAYLPSDRFDRVRLDVAISVDDVLASLRRGLEADYGTAPQLPEFYLDFDGLDGQTVQRLLELGFERDGEAVGPPAVVLVASVVTEAVARGAALTPAEAADVVRELRVRGATWGLIAQVQGLGVDAVRTAAERALTQRRQEVAQGTDAPIQSSGGLQAGEGDDGDPGDEDPDAAPPTDDDQAPGPDPDPGDPDPTAPGPDEDPDAETPGLVGGTIDPVPADEVVGDDAADTLDESVELLDDLLDGPDAPDVPAEDAGPLGGVTGTLGGLTDDLLEGVDETTESLGNTVGGLLGG